MIGPRTDIFPVSTAHLLQLDETNNQRPYLYASDADLRRLSCDRCCTDAMQISACIDDVPPWMWTIKSSLTQQIPRLSWCSSGRHQIPRTHGRKQHIFARSWSRPRPHISKLRQKPTHEPQKINLEAQLAYLTSNNALHINAVLVCRMPLLFCNEGSRSVQEMFVTIQNGLHSLILL